MRKLKYERNIYTYLFLHIKFKIEKLSSWLIFKIILIKIIFYRLASSTCQHIRTLLGLRWELRGREHLERDRACIIVANHQSSLDILGMFELWPVMDKCTVVAKKEIFYAWPVGLAAWLCGLIFIDRMNSESARSVINDATQEIKANKVTSHTRIALIRFRYLWLRFSADQTVDISRRHQAQHWRNTSVQKGRFPCRNQIAVTYTTRRILLLLFSLCRREEVWFW